MILQTKQDIGQLISKQISVSYTLYVLDTNNTSIAWVKYSDMDGSFFLYDYADNVDNMRLYADNVVDTLYSWFVERGYIISECKD